MVGADTVQPVTMTLGLNWTAMVAPPEAPAIAATAGRASGCSRSSAVWR